MAGGATEPGAGAGTKKPIAPRRGLPVDSVNASYAGRAGLIWLDPDVARATCTALADRLTILRPAHDLYFHERASRLADEIESMCITLDDQFLAQSRRRAIALTHDFDALAARFRVSLEHVVSSPADRLTDRQVEQLRNSVRAERLPVILFQIDTSPALMTDLGNRTGAQFFAMDAHGSSAADSGRATVVDLIRYNARTLLDAVKAGQ